MCTHCYIPFVTPSPNTSIQGWKCYAYISHTTKFSSWQSFLYHYHCTHTDPLNSTIKWLLHHLLHVTSITVSISYHKIKGFFFSRGNLTYWTDFVHKLSLGDNVEEYTVSIFCLTVKIVTIDEKMFQPNSHDHQTSLGGVTSLAVHRSPQLMDCKSNYKSKNCMCIKWIHNHGGWWEK
jgi:hypothetical protein